MDRAWLAARLADTDEVANPNQEPDYPDHWRTNLPGFEVRVDNRVVVWPNSEATDVAKEEPVNKCLICGQPATNKYRDRCDECAAADDAASRQAIEQAKEAMEAEPGPNAVVISGEALRNSVVTGEPVIVDLREEPMESTLMRIGKYETDVNFSQGNNKDELQGYCRELIREDPANAAALRGYSSWNKPKLVRVLGSLAGLKLDFFAGAEETVTPDEQEADEAREATIQAAEAEKDAQPAPQFSEADIENAKRQIAIWRKKPRSPRTILALEGWTLKLQIMEGVNKGKDMSALAALYREKAAQFKALGTEPEVVQAPVSEVSPNPDLRTQLVKGLNDHGIRFHLEEDGKRLVIDENDIAIRLARHGAKTIYRTISRVMNIPLWAMNGWIPTVFAREK